MEILGNNQKTCLGQKPSERAVRRWVAVGDMETTSHSPHAPLNSVTVVSIPADAQHLSRALPFHHKVEEGISWLDPAGGLFSSLKALMPPRGPTLRTSSNTNCYTMTPPLAVTNLWIWGPKEMTPPVKVLATRSDDLSLVLGIWETVERENWFHSIISGLDVCPFPISDKHIIIVKHV